MDGEGKNYRFDVLLHGDSFLAIALFVIHSSLHLHVTFYQLSIKKQRINLETNRRMGLLPKESHHYPTTRCI